MSNSLLHSGQQTHYGPTPRCVPVVSPVTAPPPILAITTPLPPITYASGLIGHTPKKVSTLKSSYKPTVGVRPLKQEEKWMDHSKRVSARLALSPAN